MPKLQKESKIHRTVSLWLAAVLFAICGFALDHSLSPGSLASTPYVALLALVWWRRSERFLLAMTAVATLLTVLSKYLLNPSTDFSTLLLMSSSPLIAISVSAVAVIYALRSTVSSRSENEKNGDFHRRLEASDQLHRMHFIGSPFALIEWNTDCEITEWNHAAEKLFGYKKAELGSPNLIQKLFTSEKIPSADSDVLKKSLFKDLDRGSVEKVGRAKDDRLVVCNWYHSSLVDKNGEFIGIFSIVVDVTDRQLEAQKDQNRVRVLSMLSKEEPLSDILTVLIEGVEQQLTQVMGSIMLVDSTGSKMLTGAAPNLPDFYVEAINDTEIADELGCCGTAIYRCERVVVEDISTHPYWTGFKDLAAQANLLSCWSEPIFDPTGKILGSFALYHNYICAPTSIEIKAIEEAANLAAIAIDKARVTASLRLASSIIENSPDGILVSDANNIIVSVNPSFEKITGYCADEVLGKDPKILQSDMQSDNFYRDMWDELNTHGRWQGEFWNLKKDKTLYLEQSSISTILNEDGSVNRYIDIFSDITKRKEAEDLVWKHANYDSLTGLPNRRLFVNRLNRSAQKAQRADEKIALLFLDIDHFKEVNDQIGHHLADELLRVAALRIIGCVGGGGAVSRLGGDEFTVTLENPESREFVNSIAREVLDQLSQPFRIGDEVVYLTASIGIAFYPDDCGANINELLTCADQAMYTAKDHGRADLNYYTAEIQNKALNRVRLISDLREAVKLKQFSLHYQPIVDLKTGKIHKAEALIRWNHPDKGFIRPDEFIPVTEETGLIADIGDWILKEAAAQVLIWRAQSNLDIQISINVSPVQFKNNKELCLSWLAYMEQVGLGCDGLVIEITEGLLMENPEAILGQLESFRKAGVGLSLDDFGTGYSSLSYLKKFDMDYLKIDRSFVMNLAKGSDDLVLCEAIIVMAHKLNLKVVAEGIETEEQKNILVQAGCDYGQGYFYSKPAPAEDFEKFTTDYNKVSLSNKTGQSNRSLEKIGK